MGLESSSLEVFLRFEDNICFSFSFGFINVRFKFFNDIEELVVVRSEDIVGVLKR